MKRILSTILLFIVLFTLSSCERTMTSIINNEPSLSGTVIEIQDQSILIENETDIFLVSTNSIENPNGMTHFTPGDVVTVYVMKVDLAKKRISLTMKPENAKAEEKKQA